MIKIAWETNDARYKSCGKQMVRETDRARCKQYASQNYKLKNDGKPRG